MNQKPDLNTILRLDPEGTIILFPSKVEIGQGIYTALAQIAAEELDVALERIKISSADTDHLSTGSSTTGSNSIQTEGNRIRRGAIEARHILLNLAAEHLNTSVEHLHITDGTIRAHESTGQTTYWELNPSFDQPISDIGSPKSPEHYTIVGQSAIQHNLLSCITGKPRFIHDLDLPNMVHGRVVHPPGYNAQLISLDADPVRDMPGVINIVHESNFIGVIAEREEQAVFAAEKLALLAQWEYGNPLPKNIYDHLLSQPDQAFLVVDGTPVDGAIPQIASPQNAEHTLNATYYKPYHMHASLGPSAALAHFNNEQMHVISHSQGIHSLRGALAHVLDMPESLIRVQHMEGAGCYGHNGADDVALDAALLARTIPGRPVLLKWMRHDEHAWEPYGSCMVVKMQGSLDTDHNVIDWNHDAYSHTHSGRPRGREGASNLLSAWHIDPPMLPPTPRPGKGNHGGIHRNADPLYAFPQKRVVKHFVPNSPLRTSALRGLGSTGNVFAIESFMDELAFAAKIDLVEFRLCHLADARARDVIQKAAEKANWASDVPHSGHGRGIAFAQYKNQKCYVAVIFDVHVDTTTGQIDLNRATIAADAGHIVNPDGIISQLEGGVIQAASWALKEEVTFEHHAITSRDWESYPIITFPEVPEVETTLINRPGLPSLGCGEATQGPTPAAIANAVFNAIGIRLRQMPFTPNRVLEAIKTS
jgi:nicotinate dehydrogenase subunit B